MKECNVSRGQHASPDPVNRRTRSQSSLQHIDPKVLFNQCDAQISAPGKPIVEPTTRDVARTMCDHGADEGSHEFPDPVRSWRTRSKTSLEGLSMEELCNLSDIQINVSKNRTTPKARRRAEAKGKKKEVQRRKSVFKKTIWKSDKVPGRNLFDLKNEESDSRVVARIYRYQLEAGKRTKRLVQEIRVPIDSREPIKIPFSLGGEIIFYPNYVADPLRTNVMNEILEKGLWKSYPAHGTEKEPRLHFLIHEYATVDPEVPQWGYHYGARNQIHLKGTSLDCFENLKSLSAMAKETCNVDCWRVGINAILYRAGNDRIGRHADNNQGETCIMAVVLDGPEQPRKVVFEPGRKIKDVEGLEWVEIFAGVGDAYKMDGALQKNYEHSVPKSNEDHRRIVVIFRDGDMVKIAKDIGTVQDDHSPRLAGTVKFGSDFEGLVEAHTYTRAQIHGMGAHYCWERGVSGNREDGCDAIIVSGNKNDSIINLQDTFYSLVYQASTRVGGYALLTSYQRSQAIRVFRSSKYEHYLAADPINKTPGYRYDGLYRIAGVSNETPNSGETITFRLTKL